MLQIGHAFMNYVALLNEFSDVIQTEQQYCNGQSANYHKNEISEKLHGADGCGSFGGAALALQSLSRNTFSGFHP
jgi:hypothetical protein